LFPLNVTAVCTLFRNTVFGQDDTAAAALVATLSGKEGSTAGPSAAAVAAYAQAHGNHAASGHGAEANAAVGVEDSGTYDASGAGASASAAAQAKANAAAGAARRQQTKAELEEQARQEELEGLRAEVQQYSSNGTCCPHVMIMCLECPEVWCLTLIVWP
jgi:hypothetical protein